MSVSTAKEPYPRHSARRARRLALITPLIALLAVAGCSSGSTSGGSGESASGSSGGATDAVATASKLLDQAASSAITGPSFGAFTPDQIVPWTAAAMPAPEALPKGKKISIDIVYGLAVGEGPYLAELTAAMAKKLGWSAKIIRATDQSQPSTLAAFQQAVNDKPTAILALVVPGAWVGGAIAKAKSQGIFTINIHQDSTTGPGYDAWVPAAEGIQKSLLAAFAIKSSNGKASSLLFDAPGFSDVNMPAASSYLSACGTCKTESVKLNPLDLIDPVKVQSGITASLASHPGVDYLMWPTAALPLQPVIAAIRSSTSKNAKLLVNGMGPAPMGLVKAGAVPMMVQAADALLPLVALDDVSRLVQKKPVVAQDALRLPISYWTPSTVPAAKNFTAITKAQLANDFITPYEKAWGVPLRDTVLGVNG